MSMTTRKDSSPLVASISSLLEGLQNVKTLLLSKMKTGMKGTALGAVLPEGLFRS